MKKVICYLVFLIIVVSATYAGLFEENTDEPVNINAGKSTYKWEIEKILLENTNSIVPYIVQGDTTLSADTIIYDYQTETGYAYGNIRYVNSAENMILTAGEGTYYADEKKIIVEINPVIQLLDDGTTASSSKMIIYTDKDYMKLYGNVRIIGEDFELEGDKATLYQRTGEFKIDGAAKTKQSNTTIIADSLDIKSKNNEIQSYTAIGNVNIVNEDEQYTIIADRVDFTADHGYTAIGNVVIDSEKEETIITADRVDSIEGEGYSCTGNVTVIDKKEETIITAERVDSIEGEGYLAIGNVIINSEKEETVVTADRVNQIEGRGYIAEGEVRVENDKDNYILVCEKIDYYEENEYSRITGNPVMEFTDSGIIASSIIMDRYESENKANLMGDVVIINGEQKAYSRWGEYDIDNEVMYLTGNPILINKDSEFNAFQVIVDLKDKTMSMLGGGIGFFRY